MKINEKDFITGLWNKATSQWVKWVHRNLSENHCEECLVIGESNTIRFRSSPFIIRLCRIKNAMAETRNDLPMINFLLSRRRETQIGCRLSSDKAM